MDKRAPDFIRVTITILLTFLVLCVYVNYLDRSVDNNNNTYLKEIYEQIDRSFCDEMEEVDKILDECEKNNNVETYSILKDVKTFENIIYYNKDGNYCDINNIKGKLEINKSNDKSEKNDVIECIYDGNRSVIISRDIEKRVIDGLEYDCFGILLDEQDFCSSFIKGVFDSNCNCYITDNFGEIMLRYDGLGSPLCQEANLLKYIEKSDFRSIGSNLNDITKKSEVIVRRFVDNDIDKYLIITPLDINNWYLLSTTPTREVSFFIDRFQNTSVWLAVIVAGLMVLMCQVIMDIFKKLKFQEQLELAISRADAANKAKSRFLFNMSHDIRTPMNAIIGMTALAEMNIDDKEKVSNYIRKINISSEHLLSLINDVLDMASIESGKFSLKIDTFSLNNLMRKINAIISYQTYERKIHYDYSLNVEHDSVYGDFLRLQQICMNIIGNALKFTEEEGTIKVKILEEKSEKDGYARYVFSCSDTGIGMSEKVANNIFEPFERGENACSKMIEGNGLGMALTKNIVDMYNGTIDVESCLSKGTTFTVKIDLKIAEDIVNEIDEENFSDNYILKGNALPDTNKYGDKRVLIVDDKEINVEIAEELLKRTGVQIDKAYSGYEAVKKYIDNPEYYYDIVFMDIQMPGINGYEATKQIRSSNRQDSADIKIIAMTADVFCEDVERAMHSGMNAHVAKPVRLAEIMKYLE